MSLWVFSSHPLMQKHCCSGGVACAEIYKSSSHWWRRMKWWRMPKKWPIYFIPCHLSLINFGALFWFQSLELCMLTCFMWVESGGMVWRNGSRCLLNSRQVSRVRGLIKLEPAFWLDGTNHHKINTPGCNGTNRQEAPSAQCITPMVNAC